jgi:hypothetical protein
MTTEDKPKRTMEESIAEIEKMIPILWEIIYVGKNCERCSILFKQAAIGYNRKYKKDE